MTIDAARAAQVIDQNFVAFDTAKQNDPNQADDFISRADLETVAANADGRFSAEEVEAAQLLLDSNAAYGALDVGAGKGKVDGTIGRGDINAAMDAIASGTFEYRLLDTAAGLGGLDQYASDVDIEAALSDPGIPQGLKDALMLLRRGFNGSADEFNAIVQAMSSEDFARAAELFNSTEFNGLPADDQAVVAQTVRDTSGDRAVTSDLLGQLRDPSFQALDAAGKNTKLDEFALLHSPQFDALPASDQRLITGALASPDRKPGDADLPGNIRTLIASEGFQNLSAHEQEAVLSQVNNYPDQRSVANMERLVGKDWFQDFDLADSQRALKMVAYLSQYDAGDRTIIDNTLGKFLADDAPYTFDFNETRPDAGGSAAGDQFHFNRSQISAGNGDIGTDTYAATEIFPHEVNHLVNQDDKTSGYARFNAEYRAYYVDFVASQGREPTSVEMLDAVDSLINSPLYDATIGQVMRNGGPESDQIVAILKDLLGRDDVTKDNAVHLLTEARNKAGSLKPADPLNEPAPIPQGNLDNS